MLNFLEIGYKTELLSQNSISFLEIVIALIKALLKGFKGFTKGSKSVFSKEKRFKRFKRAARE